MKGESRIYAKAIVEKVEKGGTFLVRLEDNADHKVSVTLSGKMRVRRILVCVGDLVDIEISPYDLHKGRVIWRY